MNTGSVADCVLTSLLDRAAARRPQAPALDDGVHLFSYLELREAVEALAAGIARRLSSPEAIVACSMERSSELVVAFLATLRAGGVWLPLDPAYPKERLAFMRADARPALLLAGKNEEGEGAEVARLVADACTAEQLGAMPPHPGPGALAYLLYTSGSTGRPKGVMVEHRGLTNLARAQAELFGVEESSRVLQFASPSFDAFVSEVAMTLAAGACLHLVPRPALLPGAALAETLRERGITHVTLPPSALAVMQPTQVALDVSMIVAGEACSTELVRRWAPGRRFLNAYGPTEATVCATMGACHPEETGPPPIGRPLPNVDVLVLDGEGGPAAAGVVGEIVIGGIGLARGYWNRPEETAERFVENPAVEGGRLYRTGDLGSWRPDGRLDFHGRIDRQIKVRGYRIEPGEVESVLAGHPAVAAVAVVPEAAASGQRLVACLVPQGSLPTAGALRSYLLRHLPDYMAPARWLSLAALPMTPNGKIDRNRLPPVDASELLETEAVAPPRDPIELRLLQIWEETLGRRGLGIHSDFFAMGGDSLQAATLLDRVERELGQRLPIALMALDPTVAALSDALRAEGTSTIAWSPLVPLSRGAPGEATLLCIHPAGGTVLPYRALAAALPSTRPIFGLQAQGYEPGHSPDDSVEAMARRYADAVERALPMGPLAFAGWSFGALVALEMAQQLAARGWPVRQVIALDAALGLEPKEEGEADIVQRLIRLYGYLQERAPGEIAAAPGELPLSELVEGAVAAGIFPAGFDLAQARRLAAITAACFRAGRAYRPARWVGPLTLIRASTGAPPVADVSLGWRAIAAAGLTLLWTAGSHLSMMRAPDVLALADRIEALIEGRPVAVFSEPLAG